MRLRRPTAAAVPDTAGFSDADAELASTLDNLDDAHKYRQWIFDLVHPYLGKNVLEVGAGHGTFTELLAPGRRVMATDLSERCVSVLEERFGETPDVMVEQSDLAGAAHAGPFDTVLLINVLEHISDDGDALQQIWSLLEPGGRVILWVPAFIQLYSDFDRRIGHYRRYRLPSLGDQLREANFALDDLRYVNSVGAVAWWVVARQLGRTPTGKLGVAVYDRYFVPVVRRLETRMSPPFGQSILAIATKLA